MPVRVGRTLRGNAARAAAGRVRAGWRRPEADVPADQGASCLARWPGRLPFWSDRIGLGVPLVAESHVAAFYPPNWLFYRFCDVPTAYRLLDVAALGRARPRPRLPTRGAWGSDQAGAVISAVSFALCGFQAVHVVHEPFYHAMPYLVSLSRLRRPICRYRPDRLAGCAWL